MENVAEWEAVLLGKRYVQTVVGGGSLKLEIKTAAKTLAQGQSPGFVDTGAERCVNHKVHASAFIEKAFGDDGALGWIIDEDEPARVDVLYRIVVRQFIGARVV